MFKLSFLLIFVKFLLIESKFAEIGPYGIGGKYYTHEYDPEVGYPYGLSYKKYPNIPYREVGVSRALEYEEPIPGPIGYQYAGDVEYPGKIGYGPGGYGAAGFRGYPAGITKRIEYGYGPGPALGYSPISNHALGHISPQGLGLYGSHVPYGGSHIDKAVYNDEKQNVVGEHYKDFKGLNGESLNHGDVGFKKGEVAYKDIKGDSVHFLDSDGIKRGQSEGKNYYGDDHFNNEGKHGQENVLNANHNKGHNIKGFKKSHHLDETGKTEEFFDADHDQGDKYAFEGKFGKFGEGGANSYKGGFNDGRYKSGEATKQGHYDNEYFLDKAQGDHGKFGENKYAQNDEIYGLKRGFGEHGLSGNYEDSKLYKKYPIGYGSYY